MVGVLGGMGPLATVDFMTKVIESTPASCDQDHIPLIVSCIPQIPDRTQAYKGEGASPLSELIANAKRLVDADAQVIAIACNTAHLWFEQLEKAVPIPIIHIVDSAIEAIYKIGSSRPVVGLLATEATISSGLYVDRGNSILRAQCKELAWLLPSPKEISEWVMPAITSIKEGNLKVGHALLIKAANALKDRGATAIIMGCTEIPLVLRSSDIDVPLVDPTQSLASKVVEWSTQQDVNLIQPRPRSIDSTSR
nr:amino acid racemase [Polynucleobacter sp. CS-Odin-A6]